ncbi:AMP-binding protein [Phycicoccus sp. CSK15P-2]|uniref:AMP-binding protein n=1 Tax=Phycicoccus sp. CSK15P-2 TaxID=2807627 RepID=UPI001952342F|nr:AMP-binding protein [Phycicoccus sp. CSK15P-2]MBM6406086.1 AMP-binding protein [Phycicoccus sp. CSK15P-2]
MSCRDALASARDLLVEHRDDHETARAAFSWPELGDFNWALDWFDALAVGPRRDDTALVVDPLGTVDGAPADTMTYAEVSRRSARVAVWLDDLGVRPGDAVVTMTGPTTDLWCLTLALMKLQAVAVPVSVTLTADELAERAARTGARTVVCGETFTGLVEQVPALTRRVSIGGVPGPGWLRLDEADDAPAAFEPRRRTAPDAPLFVFSTSGTTSRPQLVLHTHGSLPLGQLSTMYWIGLRPGDRHLNVSATGWAKHLCSSMLAPWTAEATVLALSDPRFDAGRVAAVVEAGEVSTMCAPPTVWRAVSRLPRSGTAAGLREAVSAGEPLDTATAELVRERWGVTVRQGYGQTEIPGLSAHSPGLAAVGSIGRPLPGYRLCLLDEDGAERPDEGELALDLTGRPPGLMAGYLDTYPGVPTPPHGHHRTGDLACHDGEGNLRLVGRVDDMFKSSSYRLAPAELELVLLRHPDVDRVLVHPVPDETRGLVPRARVHLRPGVSASGETADRLFAWADQHLSGYKRVRSIVFGELPQGISGKVRRTLAPVMTSDAVHHRDDSRGDATHGT